MRAFSRFQFSFLIAVLIGGCSGSLDQVDDESPAFGGQIGQTQEAVTQADKDWWRNQYQGSRNWAIMTRANQDRNRYVGLNCKDWARRVVSDASHGVVNLPATSPDASGWHWAYSQYVMNAGPITNAIFGDIVQQNHLQGGGMVVPHTAIVLSNDNTNICWIESNWSVPMAVTTRCESLPHFLSSVTVGGVQRYSLYRITGG